MDTAGGVSGGEEPKSYGWLSNSRDVLLVVVALITQLTFSICVNPPMGFWQEDEKDEDTHKAGGSKAEPYKAGGSIMKDRHYPKYWVLSVFGWLCFYSSMLLIVSLLAGVSPKSRWMKAGFVFCLSTLALIYQVSMPDKMIRYAFIVWGVFLVGSAIVLFRTRQNK